MRYKIVITKTAEKQITNSYNWIKVNYPLLAEDWLEDVKCRIFSLEEFPLNNPIAPESKVMERELRHMIIGKKRGQYRVIYSVKNRTITVHYFKHSMLNPFRL